jgi:hypothetical protein
MKFGKSKSGDMIKHLPLNLNILIQLIEMLIGRELRKKKLGQIGLKVLQNMI